MKHIQNSSIVKNITKFLVAVAFMVPALSYAAALPTPDCNQLSGTSCTTVSSTPVTELLVKIINVMLGLAFIIAVIVLIIGGFKYIFSGGNEDKATEGRKQAVNALIGIAIIILSYLIVQIVVKAVGSASSGNNAQV